jgi:acyl-CoA reductase-like NAD-dependent aldehyde dehydrogenase
LDARNAEFVKRIVEMTGCTKKSAQAEVDTSVERLFTYAAWADKYGGTIQETTLRGITVAVNEPMGVIGIACPDEYPLLGFVSLMAPAIARGNTVVMIPSQVYPLSALDFYQVLDTSDVPGGVVNIVTGGWVGLSPRRVVGFGGRVRALHQRADVHLYPCGMDFGAVVSVISSEERGNHRQKYLRHAGCRAKYQ